MTFTSIGRNALTLAEEKPKGDGSRRGEIGFARPPRNSGEIALWLADHSPKDMDAAAVSRALSHGVNLSVRYEGRYPSGPNGERLPSYQVAVGCDAHGGDRAAALADLVNFQTPAPAREIEKWLAELSVISAGKGREGFDAELAVTSYTSRLSEFPADVVRWALLEKTWKWFPAWEELEKQCRAKASPRRQMIAILSQPEPEPEQERRPMTEEERERARALIAEKFPSVNQGMRARALAEATKGDCMTQDTTTGV